MSRKHVSLIFGTARHPDVGSGPFVTSSHFREVPTRDCNLQLQPIKAVLTGIQIVPWLEFSEFWSLE